jgi:phosphoribosyl-ATP pyrophosphohydrolase
MARLKKKESARRAASVSVLVPRQSPTNDTLDGLYAAVSLRGQPENGGSRTGKLLAAGIPKMAQKVVEEAAEVAIEAVRGQRQNVVCETADLFYNVVVLLNRLGIQLDEVWMEMVRRERLFGIAEKLPKALTPDDQG